MASFESEATRVIDNFNGGNFKLWKFKIKMLLAFMDLWDIVDASKISNFIIGLNLAETNLRTTKIAKDSRKCGRHFATFTTRRFCPTSSSFSANFSRRRCNKATTCWTTSTKLRCSHINLFVERYPRETITLS